MSATEHPNGDPHDIGPEEQRLRIDDRAEIDALMPSLVAQFGGTLPYYWNIDPSTIHKACDRAGWMAIPLPGDRAGDASGSEMDFYLDVARRAGMSLRLVNLDSRDAPGPPSTKWADRLTSRFRRIRRAPGDAPWPYDVYRVSSSRDHATLEDRWWYGILTTPTIEFIVLESDEYHLLLGPERLVNELYSQQELRDLWAAVVADSWFWPDAEAGRARMGEWIEALLSRYHRDATPPTHS